MEQIERMKILLSSVEASVNLICTEVEKIQKALVEWKLKIGQADEAMKQAQEPYHYFPVKRVLEGFAFWNTGGYSGWRNKGQAMMAAGYDVTPLKVLKTMREANGRHVLTIVYQGCFLVEAEVLQNGSEFARIYQIISFINRRDNCLAKCQQLYSLAPSSVVSKMAEGEEKRFEDIIGATVHMALVEGNTSTVYRW